MQISRLPLSRTASAVMYLCIGMYNLAVIQRALNAVGISAPWLFPVTAAVILVLWIAAGRISHTAVGQVCGVLITYAYAAQPILLPVSTVGSVMMLIYFIRPMGIAVLSGYVLSLIISVVGFVRARRIITVQYHLFTEKKLPGSNLRIVHLSDLHLGFVNNARMLSEIAARVAELSPDMICITGDTFSDGVRSVRNLTETAELFARLDAPLGKYACLGNHDAGRDFSRMKEFFSDAGICLLRDESVQPTKELSVIGRTDAAPEGGQGCNRPSPAALIQDGGASYTVLMDHQPSEVDEVCAAGVDLLLSGHTHGGQFYPLRYFIGLKFKYLHGIHCTGSLTTVVSAGTGAASPPIRLGSRGEIICIDIENSR